MTTSGQKRLPPKKRQNKKFQLWAPADLLARAEAMERLTTRRGVSDYVRVALEERISKDMEVTRTTERRMLDLLEELQRERDDSAVRTDGHIALHGGRGGHRSAG